jgi:hypothetical protein
MRVAIIYRPKNTPPRERAAELIQRLADWTARSQDRAESTYFFAAGGGFAVMDIDDSAELQRMLTEHPFTRSPMSRSSPWSTRTLD